MKAKLLDRKGAATYALVFDTKDEAIDCLTTFAAEHRLTAAHFTGLGAFRSVVLGYFEWQKKDYKRIPIDEQVEVVSLVGDIALANGKPVVHAHVVVGKADGTAYGGHLLEGRVRPTLEVVLTESPSHLRRTHDAASGLPLIDLDA
jgi:predicted DNA-binding protein with PD1-like motif